MFLQMLSQIDTITAVVYLKKTRKTFKLLSSGRKKEEKHFMINIDQRDLAVIHVTCHLLQGNAWQAAPACTL